METIEDNSVKLRAKQWKLPNLKTRQYFKRKIS